MKLNQETIDKMRPEGTMTTAEYAEYKNISIGAVKSRIQTNKIKTIKVGRNTFVYPETDQMIPDNFRPEGTLTLSEYIKKFDANKALILGRIQHKNLKAEKIHDIWFLYPETDKLNPDNFRPEGALTDEEYANKIGVNKELIKGRIRRENIRAEKINSFWFVFPDTDKLNPDNFRPEGALTLEEYSKKLNVDKLLINGRRCSKNIKSKTINGIVFVYPETDKLKYKHFKKSEINEIRPEGTLTIEEYANNLNLLKHHVTYRIKNNKIDFIKIENITFLYPETDQMIPDNFRPEGALTLNEYSMQMKIPEATARSRIIEKNIESKKIHGFWFVFPETDKVKIKRSKVL